MPIKDLYNTRGDQIKDGDVFVATVAVHVFEANGKLYYRAYRCPYPKPQIGRDGVPQGDRIYNAGKVVEEIMPVLSWAGAEPD